MAMQQYRYRGSARLAALWSIAISMILLAAAFVVGGRMYASAHTGTPGAAQCDGRQVRFAIVTHHVLTDTWIFDCEGPAPSGGASKFQ